MATTIALLLIDTRPGSICRLIAAWCLICMLGGADDPTPAAAASPPVGIGALAGLWSYDADATETARPPRDHAQQARFDATSTLTVATDHVDVASVSATSFVVTTWRIIGGANGRYELEAKDDVGAVKHAAIAGKDGRIAWSEQDAVVALFSRAMATQRCCSDPLARPAKR